MTNNKRGRSRWHHHLTNVLMPKIENLKSATGFGAFHKSLVKLAQAHVNFFNENISVMIVEARTPDDVEAVTHSEEPAEILRKHKIPWGWKELIAAMMEPSGRRHKTKSGKRRKISVKNARAWVLNGLTLDPARLKKEHAKSKRVFRQNQSIAFDGDLSKPMISGEEFIRLLDAGSLPPVTGEWIAREYQVRRVNQTGAARKAALRKKQFLAGLRASLAKRKHHRISVNKSLQSTNRHNQAIRPKS